MKDTILPLLFLLIVYATCVLSATILPYLSTSSWKQWNGTIIGFDGIIIMDIQEELIDRLKGDQHL
jgi:hypothetical protein